MTFYTSNFSLTPQFRVVLLTFKRFENFHRPTPVGSLKKVSSLWKICANSQFSKCYSAFGTMKNAVYFGTLLHSCHQRVILEIFNNETVFVEYITHMCIISALMQISTPLIRQIWSFIIRVTSHGFLRVFLK